MGRFALCIPDGSDGTRALPPCPDRRWQVAGTAGQPYLVFRSLAFQPGHGAARGIGQRSPARRSLRRGHGCSEPWDEIPGPSGCGPAGSPPTTGELAPESSFTSRDLWIEAMDDRLLHHCIHTDPDGAGPAPGEPCVGRGDPWAKPEAIVEPLPLLSPLGVMTTGAAAASLAPSPTAGTGG